MQEARARATSLDRSAILAAAVALVDREGLAGLNMRALAQDLGVGTMSVYHYVPNKDALLDGIVETLLLEIEIPAPEDGTWHERARRMAQSLRAITLRHPHCVPLLVTRPFATIDALRPVDAAFGLLAEAGLNEEQALISLRTIVAYIFGFVMMESAGFFTAQADRVPAVGDLEARGLTKVAAVMPRIAGRDIGADFEAGLRTVLFGGSPPPAG